MSSTLNGLRSALTAYWSGKAAALLLPGFNGGVTPVIDELERHGATVSVVITATPPAPDAPQVPHVWDMSMYGGPLGRRDFERWLHEPDPSVGVWLDHVDPERSLIVLGNQYASAPRFCGRAAHGWRRPEWGCWEDKIRIEELWREIDAPSPTYVIGSPDDKKVRRASDLDAGAGLVVARDSSRGFWGGARGLRWVHDPAELGSVLDGLRGEVDRVRVARFVEGVPCSVIGLILKDGVAVFDPIEIVTLRAPDERGLMFCGTSTRWRPSPDLAEEIRGCALRAGRRLSAVAGLRGLFSVDGIATPGGFLATELNPRLSGGLGLAEALPALSENLLHRGVQELVPGLHDADPAAVEELIRDAISRAPSHDVLVPADGGDTVRLEAVDPLGEEGLVAPAAVALAAASGGGNLFAGTESVKGEVRW